MSANRVALLFIVAITVAACGSIEDQYWFTGVRRQEWAEIRNAIRSVTSSPVDFCSRSREEPADSMLVFTVDGKAYRARKIRGKWYFTEVVIITLHNDLTKRWSESLPDATFSFQMTKTVSTAAAFALGSDRSASSR